MNRSEPVPASGTLPLRAGDRVGPYRLVEHIGAGGMGDVWRAVDTDLEREVALKTLRPELASRSDLVERFRVEAIALAKLHHRHIAAVYACFADNGRQHMAQQFVRGRTLEAVLAERGRLPWPQAVAIARDLLAALDHAHGLGVVHRDLKPANVILDDAGRAVVLDFGIARITSRQRQTRAGTLVGTLHYLAPELIRGCEADARSDLYAVATLLHEMLGGQVPFDADSDFDLMRAVLELPAPSLQPLAPDVPPALVDLVARGLDKQPEKRPADAKAFDGELAAIPMEDLAGSRPEPAPGKSRDRSGVAAGHLARLLAPGRLWSVLDLPTTANQTAWLEWSRANPGLSAGALAVLVLCAVMVWPKVQHGTGLASVQAGPATAATAATTDRAGGPVIAAAPGAPAPPADAPAHTDPRPRVMPDADLLDVSRDERQATLPPLNATPRGPIFQMPAEPSASVSVETGRRPPRAAAPGADPARAAGPPGAQGSATPQGTGKGTGSPPNPAHKQPGWYVRQ